MTSPSASRAGSLPAADLPLPSRRRRAAEAVAFVAVWVSAGYALGLDDNAYLLLGIPLTAAFQVLVRRRPLRELFASGTPRFALSKQGVVVAVLLALVPGWFAGRALAAGELASSGWYLAAMAGAVAAAFSLRATTVLATLRGAALPVAVGAGGMVAVYGTIHLVTGAPLPATDALTALAKYAALYFPATFLLEEVAFRGAVDAHVHHEGESRGWWSAALVSALWGLWHLPVSADLQLPFPLLVAELVVVHVALGVPLSFAWRRRRNLAAPALAHAVNDAVRNAVMLGL